MAEKGKLTTPKEFQAEFGMQTKKFNYLLPSSLDILPPEMTKFPAQKKGIMGIGGEKDKAFIARAEETISRNDCLAEKTKIPVLKALLAERGAEKAFKLTGNKGNLKEWPEELNDFAKDKINDAISPEPKDPEFAAEFKKIQEEVAAMEASQLESASNKASNDAFAAEAYIYAKSAGMKNVINHIKLQEGCKNPNQLSTIDSHDTKNEVAKFKETVAKGAEVLGLPPIEEVQTETKAAAAAPKPEILKTQPNEGDLNVALIVGAGKEM